jgi:hypothetical protein
MNPMKPLSLAETGFLPKAWKRTRNRSEITSFNPFYDDPTKFDGLFREFLGRQKDSNGYQYKEGL